MLIRYIYICHIHKIIINIHLIHNCKINTENVPTFKFLLVFHKTNPVMVVHGVHINQFGFQTLAKTF